MDFQLPGEYLSLAVVAKPHGLKGDVKTTLTCGGVERLVNCQALKLVQAGKDPIPVTVTKTFQHTDGSVVVRLREIEGRDAAEAIRGAYLAVLEKDAAPLPEGQYRRHELLGLAVETVDGRPLGKLEDLLEMPAQWVLVVRDGEKELLLPAHPAMVKRVDLKTRRVVVDYVGEVSE